MSDKWNAIGQKVWPRIISNDYEQTDEPGEKMDGVKESVLVDPEIVALSYIVEVLMPLTRRQRERIIAYAIEKLEDDSGAPEAPNRADEKRVRPGDS